MIKKILLILVLIAAFTGEWVYTHHLVDVQKQRADNVIQQDSAFYYSFCEQAKVDHLATGDKESKDLVNLCGE